MTCQEVFKKFEFDLNMQRFKDDFYDYNDACFILNDKYEAMLLLYILKNVGIDLQTSKHGFYQLMNYYLNSKGSPIVLLVDNSEKTFRALTARKGKVYNKIPKYLKDIKELPDAYSKFYE